MPKPAPGRPLRSNKLLTDNRGADAVMLAGKMPSNAVSLSAPPMPPPPLSLTAMVTVQPAEAKLPLPLNTKALAVPKKLCKALKLPLAVTLEVPLPTKLMPAVALPVRLPLMLLKFMV